MTAIERLAGASTVFLDTAPVIYLVEGNPRYIAALRPLFERIDAGDAEAVVTPITLAECLVHPLRRGDRALTDTFGRLLASGHPTLMVDIDALIGRRAAELRATHNLTLTDSLQLSASIAAECDVFLTNDRRLERVNEARVIVLDDMLSL
jgi:predicted nucleic acid-binding protein